MAGTTFDQVRRFGTDAYGLERFLRLIQASVQILVFFFLGPRSLRNPKNGGNNLQPLLKGFSEVKGRLGLVRRFFRLFRFLDAFTNSYNISLLLSRDGKPEESQVILHTLDASAAAFNGGYLFLESLTIVNALGIPEVATWGPEWENVLKIESQRCWFLALAAGVAASSIRLFKVRQRMGMMQQTGDGATKDTASRDKGEDGKKTGEGLERVAQRAQLDADHWRIVRKLAACSLDLVLPGSVIGWVPVTSGVGGICMFVTSILTGLDVWERCGKEVGRL